MKSIRMIYTVLLGLNLGLIVGESIFGSSMKLIFLYAFVAVACAFGIVATSEPA